MRNFTIPTSPGLVREQKQFKQTTHQRRKTMQKLLTALFLFAISASQLFAGNYTIDKNHSEVSFSVTHMVISEVEGNFSDYTVDLNFDQNDLSKFSVETIIKIASINTENEKRDNHLKSPDFFDAAKYPDMIFKSNKLEKTDKGYIAHGTLSMHGISKEVSLPFKVTGPIKDPWGNTRIGVKATLEINRQDFKVKWSQTMDGGGLVVSDEVEINISAEFILNK
jgi:polyisoprenoid-binding protein YceI